VVVSRRVSWVHDAKTHGGDRGYTTANADSDHRGYGCPIKIAARKFSGFKTNTIYSRTAAITDPEKTVIDCIDRPDLAGGPAELTRIVYTAMGEIDHEKLVTAAKIQRVVGGPRLLEDLTDLERNLAGDDGRRADVEALRDDVEGRVGAHSPKPRWRFPASTFRPGSAS